MSEHPDNSFDFELEVKRNNVFETPIVRARVDQAEPLLSALETAVRRRREEDPDGIKRSNIGAWQSDHGMLDWGGSAAWELCKIAAGLANSVSAFIEGEYAWVFDMWGNINGPNGFSRTHVHSGVLWACVLYLQTGASDDGEDVGGEFYVEDPRYPLAAMRHGAFRYANAEGVAQGWKVNIKPTRGDIILFPAWMQHGVMPYRGASERISIAMNIDAQLKTQGKLTVNPRAEQALAPTPPENPPAPQE